MSGKADRKWTNGLILLAAIFAAVLLCEILVRVLGLAPEVQRLRVDQQDSAYQRSDNPILGYELKPGYQSTRPGFHSNYAFINAHGFRDVEREKAKPVGTTRVAVLGDSVVLGHGLPDLNQTISRQLDVLTGPSVEALNMAVGGYCTRAEVALLEARGLAFSPDVVVLVFVENDWHGLNTHIGWVGENQERPDWAQSLFLHSSLFRLLSLRLDWFGFRTGQGPTKRMMDNMGAIGDDNVSQGLRRLAALGSEHDMRVLVAIWPRFTDTAVVEVERDEVRPDDAVLSVEKVAQAVGLPTVRLSKAFRADWARRSETPSPLALYSQPDRMHPSALGSTVAARALMTDLEQRGWLVSDKQ